MPQLIMISLETAILPSYTIMEQPARKCQAGGTGFSLQIFAVEAHVVYRYDLARLISFLVLLAMVPGTLVK